MFIRKSIGLLRRAMFNAQATTATTYRRTTSSFSIPLSSNTRFSHQYDSGVSTWRKHNKSAGLWIILYGQAAIILGLNGNLAFADDVSVESGSENNPGEANLIDLRRIKDGSVISNSHTAKWRIFTDQGRDLFRQGELEKAENYFLLALQEAEEGFGKRDPHVASACHNLADLYRVKREFDKAEPLYLEAINILEESFGPEDIRVGAAFHNFGRFYLAQRKLEEAHGFYERLFPNLNLVPEGTRKDARRALKIKGRLLGHGHPYYAETMFHLGTVTYLQGMENDAVTLIQDSIKILEEAGQGESVICTRRLRYLSQIFLKSNRLTEAENVQRKILHILELSKGWNSLETVIAAEQVALTIQSNGNLKEAQELLERCLDVRETILPNGHIQIGANMLHIARVAMLNASRLRMVDISEESAELVKAKVLLDNSIRISRQILDSSRIKISIFQNDSEPKETGKDKHAALVILLQSLNALALLEITKQELQERRDDDQHLVEAENAYHQCITAFKKVRSALLTFPLTSAKASTTPNLTRSSEVEWLQAAQSKDLRSICNSQEVKAEYLSCLKNLLSLLSDNGTQTSRKASLQELKEEIKQIEVELSTERRHRN